VGKKRNSKNKSIFKSPRIFFFEGSDLSSFFFVVVFKQGEDWFGMGKDPVFYGMLMFWVEWSVEEKE
jgi:hypothetical protein